MKTTRIPHQLCPKCGYLMDAATPTTNGSRAKPRRGSYSICFSCAEILQFDAELRPQTLTPESVEAIRKDAELADLLRLMQREIVLFHLKNPDARIRVEARARETPH